MCVSHPLFDSLFSQPSTQLTAGPPCPPPIGDGAVDPVFGLATARLTLQKKTWIYHQARWGDGE